MKYIVFLILYFHFITTTIFAKKIAPGVHYHHFTSKSQSIHVLVVNPTLVDIKIGIPDNNSTQKTSSIALQHNAIAAINGGFFYFKTKNLYEHYITLIADFLGYDRFNALPSYTLQSNGKIYATSYDFTGAIGWNKDNMAHFGTIKTSWASIKNILASTPLLLANNSIVPFLYTNNSQFYVNREPRSAVGVLKNGYWVLVVVDGRDKIKKGFTLVELARFMQKLGCTDALNLCGASRSAMVINGKVISSPSGAQYHPFRQEYPVANALMICAKHQND